MGDTNKTKCYKEFYIAVKIDTGYFIFLFSHNYSK